MSAQGFGYAAPPQPVDREVTGVLAGMENRNAGWVRFAIMEPGRQYPVKVDTKKPEIIQQCMALQGQMVTASIREQQSTSINPHNGQPYTNRYLNAIAAAGYAPSIVPQGVQQPQQGWQPPPAQPGPNQFAPQFQQPQPQPVQYAEPVQQRLQGDERDLSIHRQVAWKKACDLAAAGKIEMTPQAIVEAAEVAMAYFTYGPLRFGVQPFTTGVEQGAQQNVNAAQGNGGHPFDDPLPPGQGSLEHETCPECGYQGGEHAYGCPRGTQPYTG